MLLKIPGEVEIDGEVICRNLKLNIPNQNQFRLKSEWNEGERWSPGDILCENTTWGITKGLKLHIDTNCVDMITKTPINLKFVLDPFKKNWVVTGNYGKVEIHEQISMIPEVLGILKKYINNKTI